MESSSPLPAFLTLSNCLGQVCEIVQWNEVLAQGDPTATPQVKPTDEKQLSKLRPRCRALFQSLVAVAIATNADIMHSWQRKMKKVMKKYPPELCRGSSDKYTAYLEMRDKYEKNGKGHMEVVFDADAKSPQSPSAKRRKTSQTEAEGHPGLTSTGTGKAPTLADLLESRDLYRTFAAARDWDQFHTPRNLLLALAGEVGELAQEIEKHACVKESAEAPESLCDELADCWSYLVRFCDKSGVGVEALVEETEAAIERPPSRQAQQ